MTTKRERLIKAFLAESNTEHFERQPLHCDASFRSYERLVHEDHTLILMNAPPPKEDVRPFINIDNYLVRRGFSAPIIHAQDEENGFLLLEDFGNHSFTKVLAEETELSVSEEKLYIAAVDVLIQLGRSTLPANTPGYNDVLLMQECELFTKWYIPNVDGLGDLKERIGHYNEIWQKLFEAPKVTDDVVVLRDYHADNLMWLPERVGVERVGLLDFQDAVIGSPVYDLVSLFEDARRDVHPKTVEIAKAHYLQERKMLDEEVFEANYAILAAQRNCKIIGIFARLAVRDNKPRYLSYLARVWRHLEKDLEHPALEPLKIWMDATLPKSKRKASSFIIPEKECAIA
jgi:aminoglycoside/choline kinase family phosphotransferase